MTLDNVVASTTGTGTFFIYYLTYVNRGNLIRSSTLTIYQAITLYSSSDWYVKPYELQAPCVNLIGCPLSKISGKQNNSLSLYFNNDIPISFPLNSSASIVYFYINTNHVEFDIDEGLTLLPSVYLILSSNTTFSGKIDTNVSITVHKHGHSVVFTGYDIEDLEAAITFKKRDLYLKIRDYTSTSLPYPCTLR